MSKGRKNLDAVIVTHCDNDHISGIRKIFTEDNIKVKTLYMPSTTMTDEVYTELIELAAESGTDIKYIYEGYSMTEKDFYMYCLHPEYEYDTSERMIIPQHFTYGMIIFSIAYRRYFRRD